MFHSLKAIYFNANSLLNKIDELKIHIDSVKPDLIGVTETHLTSAIDYSSVFLHGYTLYRSDRTGGIHGGVAIYINSEIPSYQLHTKSDPAGEWESLWCCVKPKNSITLKVGCCYRVPSTTMPTHWPSFLSMLNYSQDSAPKAPTLLIGDFNFPTVNWSSLSTTQSEFSASQEFLEFVQDNDLTQYVQHPTRHREGQVSSLLDLVIATNDIQVTPVTHLSPLGRSDHDMLYFNLDFDFTINVPNTPKPNFWRADFVLLNDIISSIHWESELRNLDVDSQLNIFLDFLENLILTFVPVTTIRHKPSSPPWSDKTTRTLVNKKKKAYNRFRKYPTPTNLALYKAARNSAVSGIRQSRKLTNKILS